MFNLASGCLKYSGFELNQLSILYIKKNDLPQLEKVENLPEDGHVVLHH